MTLWRRSPAHVDSPPERTAQPDDVLNLHRFDHDADALDETQPAEAAYSPNEEARLLRLAQHDPSAFAPIYEHYFDRVYHYCLRRVDDPQEAEDLCSQVFTRVLTGLHTYRGGLFAAWLFQIAHHVVVNHYRARRVPFVSLDTLDLPDDTTWDTLEEAEAGRLLGQLIAELTDEQRELVALMLDAELTSSEIGAILGKSAGAVRIQLHRIIKALRERYHKISGDSLL
ncbi:MAG: sigma-70 family RNA polymerase sigma factor [bacterium]|nr:sigma-70 family RNA polymerase sigma factor [bacterium]